MVIQSHKFLNVRSNKREREVDKLFGNQRIYRREGEWANKMV